MKIGIDINEANVKNRVGTGQYCFELLKRWSTETKHDFHLYHRDDLVADLPPEREILPAVGGWHYHQVGPKRGWLRIGLPLYLLTHKAPDVFWSPAHYAPTMIRGKNVVTIHDLAYEYFPELFLESDLYKLKNWTRSAVKNASHVIAVSEATKQDLIKLYELPSSKITVVHNGYDSDFFNPNAKSSRPPYSYLLFLGTIQPRKNLIKLVQAFHLLKGSGYKGKLVIAGKIGWLAEETLEVIRTSPESKDIIMTGYIDDETRRAFYTHADVFILPSLYEGFGLPAIEAMACGAPVAVSNNSSLPEVVGQAGLLFNPYDPADIARAVLEIKGDRESWVKKGLARAKHFSWDKSARETLSVLKKVASEA